MPSLKPPHIVTDHARNIAERAIRIEWFHSVGVFTASNESIVEIYHWSEALACLTSQVWDDYLLDVRNTMVHPVPRPQLDDWGWVFEATNEILDPIIPRDVYQRVHQNTGEAMAATIAEQVTGVVRLACVEAHFQKWVPVRRCLDLFQWLENGHLPCGATTSEVRTARLKVL